MRLTGKWVVSGSVSTLDLQAFSMTRPRNQHVNMPRESTITITRGHAPSGAFQRIETEPLSLQYVRLADLILINTRRLALTLTVLLK